MKTNHIFALTLIAGAMLAGCSSLPASNPNLEQARSDYRVAQSNPQAVALAGGELKQASDALDKANDAWNKGDKQADVDHLAYIAKQRVAIAQETAKKKESENAVSTAEKTRDKVVIAARTNEADAAKLSAESAQRQAEAAQRQSVASQKNADASQQQANDAQARNLKLEAELKDLNATKTERGMVITIGDVLFDTNKAELKATGMRGVEKLADFLKLYPMRKALIEGFTDSVGSADSNQELSGRRADAVRVAMVGMGVGSERIATHGYGEAYPVAGNDNASGRQQNRRVEIILSDEKGTVAPR
jgi:outer membrane protein OmpA-like peptidoglycan-associated protein